MKGNNNQVVLTVLYVALFLGGCSNAPLLDPKGPIGSAELFVIGMAFALMLIVVIPVIVMALWFPRGYKASNPKGDYAPNWSYSHKIELTVWLVPAAIVTALSIAGWTGYAPLTEKLYSTGMGVDYWIWALQIAGIGSLLTGINYLSGHHPENARPRHEADAHADLYRFTVTNGFATYVDDFDVTLLPENKLRWKISDTNEHDIKEFKQRFPLIGNDRIKIAIAKP
jgi:heme/copper-type cytochrome/quinol oxidase subunit 2